MNEENSLPIQYRIEFYEGSCSSSPVFYIYTSTPPFSISVADKVDQLAWGDKSQSDLPQNKIYEVTKVIHRIHNIDDSHVLYDLSVVLISVDRQL